ATLNVSTLAVGAHPITAAYQGDGNFLASTSQVVNEQINGAAPTATILASSPAPSVFGQAVTFTATVLGALVPSGTVTFKDGTTDLGTRALDGTGKATLLISSLGVGAHSVTAYYNGDTSFLPSTSAAAPQQVNKAATTTAAASSPNPAVFGAAVTLSAAVAVVDPGAGTPTGTVTFYDGTTCLGPGNLDAAGHATL